MKKGEKVKCIDDCFVDEPTNPFRKSQLHLPEENEIYTIREMVKTDYGVGVRLEEIRNDTFYFDNIKRYEEPIFGIYRFETIENPNSQL